MTRPATKLAFLLLAALTSGSLASCGSNSTAATGNGGQPSGGTLGLGGSRSGGASGAGTTSAGGASAAGGSLGSGGHLGNGGSGSSGSSTGGTVPGSGGSAGVSGSPLPGGSSEGGTIAGGGSPASGGANGHTGNGGTAGGPGNGDSGAGGSSAGDGGGAGLSAGCGKTPSLHNSPSSTTFTPNSLTPSGSTTAREYVIRWPTNYNNTTGYRLILDFHGYGGSYSETAGEDYFGLWSPSNNTTIFIALSAINGDWSTGDNDGYVDAVLSQVEADLCIDTSHIQIEGFSQGAQMAAVLACARPGIFSAVAAHSRGSSDGPNTPTTCAPIPYLGSLGSNDVGGNSQATQSDPYATWNGCKITTLPTVSSGSGTHVCTNYTGCPAADPVIFCSFDGPHTWDPTDSGQTTSWMPKEVWGFFSQF